MTIRDVFDRAYRYALDLDHRNERLSGTTLATSDLTDVQRLNEAEYRILSMLNTARTGERIPDELVYAAMAHLAALNLSTAWAEEHDVTAGAEAA